MARYNQRRHILRDVIRYGFELCVIVVLLAAVVDFHGCTAGAATDPGPTLAGPELTVRSTQLRPGVELIRTEYGPLGATEVCYALVTEMGGMVGGHQGSLVCR